MVSKAKTILWIKLMTLSFVMAIGCAPKSKKSEAKLNLISSMAIADINMDGGAIVYGEQLDGPGKWGNIFRPGDDVVVDMAQGVWNFSIIAYSGPTALSGLRECAVLNKINIAEEKEVIDVVISSGACGGAGVRGLLVQRCTQADFDSADPLANCSQADGIESYRLRLMGHRNGKPTGDFLESQCFTEATFSGSGNPKVPMGITNVRTQPFVLLAYTGTACDPGTDSYVPFQEALSIPNNGSIKSFNSGANLTLVINNDGNGLDNVAPNVDIAGTSAISGNGENWINQANQSSFNFGGNCETGLPIQYFLNGAPLGSGTCSSSIMNDSFDLSGYPDTGYGATYTVEARQVDGAGNVGSSTIALRKDATLPTSGSVSSLAPVPVNTNYIPTLTPTLTINKGTDTSGSGSITYTLKEYTTGSCGGGFTTQQITEPASTFNLTLVDASTNSFRVTTTDYAGNTSLDSPCYGTDIIVDTTDPATPTAPLLNAGVTITNDNTPNISWTPSVSGDVASQEIEIYDPGCASLQATVAGLSSVATTHTLSPLTNGTYSVRVVAVDNAGNRTSSACTNNTIVDTTNPTIASGISFSTSLTNDPNSITATFGPGTDNTSMNQYTVNFYNDGVCAGTVRDSITVPSGGPYTASAVNLAVDGSVDGTYKVQIISIDSAGNTNTSPCSTATAVFDTTPPNPSTGLAWDTTTTIYNPRLDSSIWTNDIGSGADQIDLNVYSGSSCSGTVVYSSLAQPNTFTDFLYDVATEGTYSFGVTARDAAGNNSSETCSPDLSFIQEDMGLGTRFWDAEMFGTRVYFVTHAGSVDIFDETALPNYNKLGGFKVNGFRADKIINFNNNYALLYDKSTGQMHAWKYTAPGTLDDPEYAGSINTGVASIKDHAQSGSILFLLDGSDNLHGIDLSSITTPAVDFVSFSVGSGCNAIEVDPVRNYLYAGCGSLLKPVDLSGTPTGAIPAHNPTSAMVFDHLAFNPNNNFLYAAGDGIGGSMAQIDTSTPNTPETTGPEMTGTGNILSLGNFSGTEGVICIDGAPDEAHRINVNPSPALKNRLDTGSSNKCEKALVTPSNTISVSVNGASARPENGGPGPLDPGSRYMDGGTAFKITHDIDPSGTDYAAVGLLTGGISILNTSNKRKPFQVSHMAGSNRAVVAGTGNTLYALDGITFRRYDMTTITAPSGTGSVGLNPSGPTFSPENQAPMILNPSGPGYAYIGGQDGVVAIVNTGSVTLVSKITSCSGTAGNHVRGLNYINNFLVVACLDGDIFTYNLAIPATPVPIDSITATKNLSGANQEATGLARANNYFYTALENNGIDIFEVNPTTGFITDHPDFDPTERITSLFRPGTNSFMYAATANSVIKIQITTPTSLSVIQTVSTPTIPYEIVPAQDISLNDPLFLYMATGNGGVQVIDASRSDALFQ